MNHVQRWLVWLSRINKCRGFGIQSPTDYAFVRYVVNERWPYYAYESLKDNDWLTQKLGRLYFRLANWRRPTNMVADDYQRFWQAGCRTTHFMKAVDKVELARIDVEDLTGWNLLLPQTDSLSVVVVEGIWRHRQCWQTIVHDEHTGTTFDLYYCGIVFFDKDRYSHHYQINF